MEERYVKQMNFKGIGGGGQALLSNGKVLIIGCGALGTVVANSLVRSGVGFIRIVDRDFVELTNLHRQILFDEEDVRNNMPKAVAAYEKLIKVNPAIKIEPLVKDVNSITIEWMAEGMDLIIDCTDNFKTRYLINDVSVAKNIPWIYGGAIGSAGVIKSFIPGRTPCLRCMMEEPPPTGSLPTCDTAGVINTITGIVGMYQANEAIKYLTKQLHLLEENMLFIDLWDNVIESIEIKVQKGCPCCQKNKFPYLENKFPEAVHICGSNNIQVDFQREEKISLKGLYERLQSAGLEVKKTPFLLHIQVDHYEIKVFEDGRAIIKNAKTPEEAKGIYAKYIGY